MLNGFDLEACEWRGMMVRGGVAPQHLNTVWRWQYRAANKEIVSSNVQRWLDDEGICWILPEVKKLERSEDGTTVKFLLKLDDDNVIETVLMAYPGRLTACVSTQVGCAMGCVFCATGQGGFSRHLTVGEIVAQVVLVSRWVKINGWGRLRNLVLMGMGEPLHNYERVMKALSILCDTRGMNFAGKKITVSTVGVVPEMRRFIQDKRPYHLAVSLHGATEEQRNALVPVNRKWPLAELIEVCREYHRELGRKIFIEWTLISGQNDTPESAQRLIGLLKEVKAHINLIPLNLTEGFAGGPTEAQRVDEFKKSMQAAGFACTVRQRRGIEMAAGCGQLAAAAKRSQPGGKIVQCRGGN